MTVKVLFKNPYSDFMYNYMVIYDGFMIAVVKVFDKSFASKKLKATAVFKTCLLVVYTVIYIDQSML